VETVYKDRIGDMEVDEWIQAVAEENAKPKNPEHGVGEDGYIRYAGKTNNFKNAKYDKEYAKSIEN
jgi:hypothetical protein